MSSVTRLVGSAIMLAVIITSRAAFAEDLTREHVLDAAEPVARPWDASLRGGYGTVFTNGVSYMGTAFGASVGHLVGTHVRFEIVALSSSGEAVRATNAAIAYRSSYSSVQGSVGIAYELRRGALRLRPGIRAGVSLIDGYTRLGTAIMRDEQWEPIVGPCLATVVRVGRVELGVSAEAFFLPNWPAAPTGGLYAVAGIAF